MKRCKWILACLAGTVLLSSAPAAQAGTPIPTWVRWEDSGYYHYEYSFVNEGTHSCDADACYDIKVCFTSTAEYYLYGSQFIDIRINLNGADDENVAWMDTDPDPPWNYNSDWWFNSVSGNYVTVYSDRGQYANIQQGETFASVKFDDDGDEVWLTFYADYDC